MNPQDVTAEALEWRRWATGERKKPPHNLLAFTTDVAALAAELERVTAALRERDDALTTLRGAWNHHMDSCEQHQALQIPTVYEVAPVFEQIREWMNAPSATASAMPASSQGSPESALRIVRSIAVNGPGPDTTPEQTLATIAAFIDKRLAGGARAAQEDA
jgi:hypothetical protein